MSRLFPLIYDRAMEPLERKSFRRLRKKLIAAAEGSVLEIGSGTGLNFPLYRSNIRVSAIEPNPAMAKRSSERIAQSQAKIQVFAANGESLPFPDNSFDTAVGTLVFCTIPYPEVALQELRRVLKPGGKLLLLEHVKMEQSVLAAVQHVLTPAWKVLGDGCHLNRDTLSKVKDSGFKVTNAEKYHRSLMLLIEAENRKPASINPEGLLVAEHYAGAGIVTE
ncbi:class I SAM-dependent methyltransferase [Planococcus lenghuensis]|uniref:SAM-dependent methyltransferase n=1 Tax=Planococcus lenghuensis TaxID=2213202 RepID=A0A1Q2L013_9BACL|nr:class I SAM-dependent methyltransferase [Planococcus lenghuensis]AQQ53232.1 SAM-dependent methyltransferase [Planococcus lenghuensis]